MNTAKQRKLLYRARMATKTLEKMLRGEEVATEFTPEELAELWEALDKWDSEIWFRELYSGQNSARREKSP